MIIDQRWIDNALYLLVNSAGTLSLMKGSSGQIIWPLDVATRQLKRITWSPDNSVLVCVTRFNTVKMWSVSTDLAYELTEWTTYNANDEIGVDSPVFIDSWSANCDLFAMRIGVRHNTVVYVFNIDKESHQSFC